MILHCKYVKEKLLFIQLNEINFDVVSSYLLKGRQLPISNSYEISYESRQNILEPWIQWVSLYWKKI